MDASPEYDTRYLAGIDHFNRGEYFEAHEVWEDLWHECGPADRLFIQSLIQAAVALYHWGNGNRAGARRLFASGRDKMAGYHPSHLGLDVDGFWRQVAATLAGALADDPPAGPPPPAPRIVLRHESDHDR
jgi:predicted metal-dependent hydrolase